MATINASTKIMVKKKGPAAPKSGVTSTTTGARPSAKGAPARRGSVAPALKATMTAAALEKLVSQSNTDDQKLSEIQDMFRRVLGEPTARHLNQPHTASTTRDRSSAAADLALVTKTLGLPFVLKQCGLLGEMQRMLFPEGIESILTRGGSITVTTDTNKKQSDNGSDDGMAASTQSSNVLKPSASAVSLSSLVDGSAAMSITTGGGNSVGTDSKRGKNTPAAAREGCLLFLRALIEIIGKPAEPYVVGAFLVAALDECASTNSNVREAAEDTSTAIVAIANQYVFRTILAPVLLQSLNCSEWRVKAAALDRIAQCATTAPRQTHQMMPTLIPAIANQVWDTKPQVSKGAKTALLAICKTNANADILPTIPAIVNAICKPAETNKAVTELMGTTFVVPVDAATLAILCPLLARALKEKMAIHKRAACIVINNMSKLVETPQAIAPFGSLLVPELQKVARNVQFEEIRDEALKALASLTKALGDLYNESVETVTTDKATDEEQAKIMEQENALVQQEQERIEQERLAEAAKEEEFRRKEEEERKKFKDAMDAQRRLDKLEAEEAEAKRKEEEQKREMERLSTKGKGGKCQACGLKKCKKTCMFYGTN